MKLTDLEASFVSYGGEGVTQNGAPVPRREAVGVSMKCPCGCEVRLFVPFENPIDGGPPYDPNNRPYWKREGETLDTLTLSPSIQRIPVPWGDGRQTCNWHGWIRNGEAVTC